jgi:hypothetical protein
MKRHVHGLTILVFQSSLSGLRIGARFIPKDKSLGYFHLSLSGLKSLPHKKKTLIKEAGHHSLDERLKT